MMSQKYDRFRKMRASQPALTDTMLLNSNNPTFKGKPDVVVVGAGINGLCYAIQLKKDSPDLKIVVYEKSAEPCYKIGESTLSSFSRFVNGAMVPVDYLFRLFALKDGLQFYCIDQDGATVTCEDVGGHDVSFQMDRRASELFFTMWAQHMGVQVIHGVDADFDIYADGDAENTLGAPIVVLKNIPDMTGSPEQVQAKLVCDASGFSRRLTNKFGAKQAFDGWNSDAYWAYFRERPNAKAESRIQHWDYPATNHMCFPEGWGWFIKLISWQHASLANLMDLITYLIDNSARGVPAENVPCVKELSEMFSCPYEYITSIGWAVRNDHKFPDDLSKYGESEGEQKFMYFQKRYPTLDKLMTEVYELLPKYYGPKTFFVRKTMSYSSPVVAGNGWFAIGNSAGFTNPLISPGMNAGIETAFLAATLTKEVLDSKDINTSMQHCASKYQAWQHEYMIPSLNRMNRYWYNMFRDHRLFDALVPCFWATGVGAVEDIQFQTTSEFTSADLGWVVGSGLQCFQDFAKRVLDILEPEGYGTSHSPTDAEVAKVQEMSRACLIERSAMFPENKWGSYLRKYNDKLERVPGKTDRYPGGSWSATHCVKCNVWVHDKIDICPVCGGSQSGRKMNPVKNRLGERVQTKMMQTSWMERGISFSAGVLWTLAVVYIVGSRRSPQSDSIITAGSNLTSRLLSL